jgi:tetratricopeptide (TPR) repeat protein
MLCWDSRSARADSSLSAANLRHVMRISEEHLRKYYPILGGLAIVLMVLAAYAPAVHGGFVWDDDTYVTRNPLLTASDGLHRIWFTTDSPSQYFPLVYTAFRAERSLWGFDPVGYHVVNILLHIANSLLLWMILRRLRIPGAWLAAAIWAVHPVNVESVAWITELKNVLSTLFYLLTILAYMRSTDSQGRRAGVYYGLGLLFCALALFAKTTACTIPAALLIVLWIRKQPITWKRLAQVVPFGVMGVAMGLLTVWWEHGHQGTKGADFALEPMQRLLVSGHALWFYLAKVAWPVRVMFSYPEWRLEVHDPMEYIWPAACVVVVAVLWIFRKSWGRGPLIAAAFFAAALFPMLGFISLYTFRYTYVADHYQYLACAAPIAVFAVLIARWRSRAAVSAIVLAALCLLTWRQAGTYQDSRTLWGDVLAKNPQAWVAHWGLGMALAQDRQPAEAEVEFRRTMKLHPAFWEGCLNLGSALRDQGKLDEAKVWFVRGLKLKSDSPALQCSLADILVAQRRPAEAIPHYEAALKVDSGLVQAHMCLEDIYVRMGKRREAITELEAILKLMPGFQEARDKLEILRAEQRMREP